MPDLTLWNVTVAVVAVAFVVWFVGKKRTPAAPSSYPEVPTHRSTANADNKEDNITKVCVLGAGTIGSSFTAVFLAKGMHVVCYDPYSTREILEQRIQEYWPVLVARGMTSAQEPPFGARLEFQTEHLAQVVQDTAISFVQECTWENVENKQSVLSQLDAMADPSILIASSTSFIPWQLLVENCVHKHRIMIGHPAIPHTHSFMEIYGIAPSWAQHCATWYRLQAGFDVIVMNQTIPGHVFNSFLRVNLTHGLKLIRNGVCSPQDVNTAMRHLGRDMYARHANVALFTMTGGDRGMQGGLELSKRIRNDAIYLTLFSGMKQRGWPTMIASPLSKSLGRFIATLLPPPPEEWLDHCRLYEKTITQDGKIPVQTAYFQATSEVYSRVPFEPDNDPFKLPGPRN